MSTFPVSAWLIAAIFGFIVTTTVAGALIAVLSRRIIRSVAGLALCCLGLAGLYYFLNSPFLALMEILIYIGAVCVTIIFGVFWGVSRLSLQGRWPAPAPAADGSVQAIGIALLTTYSLPFELISLVLLVAILGALVIARGGRTPS